MSTIQNAYRKFYGSLKHHIALSYFFMVPLYLIQNLWGLQLEDIIDPRTKMIIAGKENLFFAIIVLSTVISQFLSLFFYRLYTCGKTQYLRLSLGKLARIYGKSFLYSLMVIALLLLALICLSTLAGLILTIFTNMAGLASSPAAYSREIGALIVVILIGLFLRTTPTLISIAQDEKFIGLKDAWYYTQGKSLSFLVLTLLAILPLYLLHYAAMGLMISFSLDVTALGGQIFLFLISPVALAPIAIFYAACSCVYEIITARSVDIQV